MAKMILWLMLFHMSRKLRGCLDVGIWFSTAERLWEVENLAEKCRAWNGNIVDYHTFPEINNRAHIENKTVKQPKIEDTGVQPAGEHRNRNLHKLHSMRIQEENMLDRNNRQNPVSIQIRVKYILRHITK